MSKGGVSWTEALEMPDSLRTAVYELLSDAYQN